MADSRGMLNAIVAAVRRGEWETARRDLDRIVDRTGQTADGIITGSIFEPAPGDNDDTFLRLYRTIAQGFARGGQDAKAADCYRRAIAVAPNFPANYNNLGNALMRLGRAGAAQRAYRQRLRAIRITPAPTTILPRCCTTTTTWPARFALIDAPTNWRPTTRRPSATTIVACATPALGTNSPRSRAG